MIEVHITIKRTGVTFVIFSPVIYIWLLNILSKKAFSMTLEKVLFSRHCGVKSEVCSLFHNEKAAGYISFK